MEIEQSCERHAIGMFGYVFVNKPELKFKEFDLYRSYYCGLCHELAKRYGIKGSLSLSYDMTFLILLLTGLYEPVTQLSLEKCLIHPIQKHQSRQNKYTEYAADMTILLAYYKCMDDWVDDKNICKYTYAKMLKKAFLTVSKKYPHKAEIIRENLRQLSVCEKNQEKDIDKVSGNFGKIVGEIFSYQEDIFKDYLYKVGFYLGKFIYLMDAYEDLEKDQKKNSYNVFFFYKERKDYEEYCKNILVMMMAESSRNFEKLPVFENVNILKNILYAGVWTKYRAIQHKKEKQ